VRYIPTPPVKSAVPSVEVPIYANTGEFPFPFWIKSGIVELANVPIPMLPPTYAFPVVVAPPEIVRPVA
jgi:hypothetical protein